MKKLWIVLILTFAVILCGCNEEPEDNDEVYREGYTEGYADGYDDGYSASDYDDSGDEWFCDAWQVRTKETGLSLRQYPSADSDKIAEIPMYEYIGVIEYSEDLEWGYIYYGSVDGWVNLDYCAPSYDVLVYATESGEKYHKEHCQYLSQSRYIITLSDAAERRLEPCSVCGGYGLK